MTTYDENVPKELKDLQQWFSEIITTPIDENSKIRPTSPHGIPIAIEAAKYIIPSPTLKPEDRIELYNQQYWWRLLSILQDTFPMATRLFGYTSFNDTIGFPYLKKYPSNHWSLNFLGNHLPQWIEEEYHANDKCLIKNCVDVDWAFNESFYAGQLPVLAPTEDGTSGDPSDVLSIKTSLQPHIHLFALPYNLFHFRTTLIKEPVEYWIENDFPTLDPDKTHYFLIYRTANCDITWIETSIYEYKILQQFQKSTSVDDLCLWLETQEQPFIEAAEENLQNWFQQWTTLQWLGNARIHSQ